MNAAGSAAEPTVLGLLDKRVDGDDALLALARLRLEQVGMGAEIYASSPDQLIALAQFRPRNDRPLVVHLPRGLDLLDRDTRALVQSMASAGQGAARALILHDQPEANERSTDYVEALGDVDAKLTAMTDPPQLCIEYAVGFEPAQFVRLIERTKPFPKVGACVDIGHVGVAEARRVFARAHAGQDICSLHPTHPSLPQVVGDVQRAVEAGRDAACWLTERIAALGKLVHMHLHDAHPLSTSSEWGVSDHLSFLEPIGLPFEHEGRWGLDTMFGPSGLARVLESALGQGSSELSFTLEIHPTPGQRPLGDAEALFAHWKDRTNAERMNYWLGVLQNNHRVLRAAHACARYGT